MSQWMTFTRPVTVSLQETWSVERGRVELYDSVTVLRGASLAIRGHEGDAYATVHFMTATATISVEEGGSLWIESAVFVAHEAGLEAVHGSAQVTDLLCVGFATCLRGLLRTGSRPNVTRSFFARNKRALTGDGEVADSVFFGNQEAVSSDFGPYWTVTRSLFLWNSVGHANFEGSDVLQSAFVQNGVGIRQARSAQDVLLYRNGIGIEGMGGFTLRYLTFLENGIGTKVPSEAMTNANFLRSVTAHIHYSQVWAPTVNLQNSELHWSEGSIIAIKDKIVDGQDASNENVGRVLVGDRGWPSPFHHTMYESDACAGHCSRDWFKMTWAKVVSVEEREAADQVLSTGQTVSGAISIGYNPASATELSEHMDDLAALFQVVSDSCDGYFGYRFLFPGIAGVSTSASTSFSSKPPTIDAPADDLQVFDFEIPIGFDLLILLSALLGICSLLTCWACWLGCRTFRGRPNKARVQPCPVPAEHVEVERSVAIKWRMSPESLPESIQTVPSYWECSSDILVMLDPGGLEKLQQLIDGTFRDTSTRDRSGSMPSKLRVVHAHRIENEALWQEYTVDRYAIKQKRRHRCTALDRLGGEALTQDFVRGLGLMEDLDQRVNEVSLWHGTSPQNAFSIARTGFKIRPHARGRLYGAGAYFAECSSKSDEYARDDAEGIHQGLYCLLLCRVLLGEPLHLTAGGDQVGPLVRAALDSDLYDSVLGDRRASVGTYREFIVYDDYMAYPEYIVVYTRQPA
ncbi:Tnks2 [Symbiodinium sp. CCMP2592]|nr:Tnks2 [Symbiodinium sp. CCMP2592]